MRIMKLSHFGKGKEPLDWGEWGAGGRVAVSQIC